MRAWHTHLYFGITINSTSLEDMRASAERSKKKKLAMAAKYMLFTVLLLLIALSPVSHSATTVEPDDKECAEQFQNLAACIPYVSGNARKPTPECCADAEKVRAGDPKCLCVLILDSASTNASIRLPVAINTTLALQMPAACNSDAKVSDCPRILNLPADSPDAKIFEDAAATVNPSSASTSSPGSTASSRAGASGNGGRVEHLVAGLLLSVAVFSI